MILEFINGMQSPWNILLWIALFVGVFAMCILITKLNNVIFKRIQRKHPGLHVMFLQHLLSILIIIGLIVLVISSFAGVKTVWTTLFGGTAIISAVLAFAAQDVIKDVLAGMMISAHSPFKVGDRIVLEDGTTGVVEDITLRHVVLKGVESLRVVIPNHVINAMRLSNFSFKTITRSATFKFSVGYDSDMAQVKKVIAKAIEKSEYTVEGYIDKDGNNRYGDVYFMSFADSALIMQVTVYYLPSTPSEKVIDDINVRVREALIANDIEIPYNYVTVVGKADEKPMKKPVKKISEKPAVIKRKVAVKSIGKPLTAKKSSKPVAKATAVKKSANAPAKPTSKATKPTVKKPVKVTKTSAKKLNKFTV